MPEINKIVGANVRKFRKQKKWSQEQLAFETGMHRAYIGQIERGEKNIGVINLDRIARSLGKDIAGFFRKPTKED